MEFALVSSLFAIFLAMIVEVSHVYLVINTLNAAAKRAARYGSAEGVSTSDVTARAYSLLGATLDPALVTVEVVDASIFDSDGFDADLLDPTTLTPTELLNAESRDLFGVRVSVSYDDVALMTPYWLKNLTLEGQSVMRHE